MPAGCSGSSHAVKDASSEPIEVASADRLGWVIEACAPGLIGVGLGYRRHKQQAAGYSAAFERAMSEAGVVERDKAMLRRRDRA